MQKQIEHNSQRSAIDMDSPTGNVIQRTLVIIAVLFLLFFVLLTGIERAYSDNGESVQKEFLAYHGSR